MSAPITANIISEFVEQIDKEKDYDLKELKQILSDVYKAKSAKDKPVKQKEQSESDNEKDKKKRKAPTKDADKPKRAPSAYNNYIKKRIQELKSEQDAKDGDDNTKLSVKELLKTSARELKLLDKAEQEKYKV